MVHLPVLVHEVKECLDIPRRRIIVDGTLGLGGHAESILDDPCFQGRYVGLDWDVTNYQAATLRLARFGDRFLSFNTPFSRYDECIHEPFDGFLLDLGVSSPHFDVPDRGFSYLHDGPLDMRMDARRPFTAGDFLSRSSEKEIAQIFREFGEERLARPIARRIVELRDRGEYIRTTLQLSDLVVSVYRKYYGRSERHPAAKVFQALRIAVNDELGELERALYKILKNISVGGRVVIISYHSLEDRIVKNLFRAHQEYFDIFTRKPIIPNDTEIKTNPRARSAKLRAVVKKV